MTTILYIVKQCLPYTICGYTVRTENVVRQWQDILDTNVIVCTLTKVEGNRQTTDHNGIRYHHLNIDISNSFNMLPISNKVKLLCKRLSVTPDTIVATCNYQIGDIGYSVAKHLGIPFVYEVRGFWELSYLSCIDKEKRDNPIVKEELDERISREMQLCFHATKVYAITRQVAATLVSRGCCFSKVELLPNSIHKANIKVLVDDTSIQKRPNVVTIGYIGSLSTYEGIDDLLICYNVLVSDYKYNLHLVIIGSNTTKDTAANYAKIQQFLEQNQLSDKVDIRINVPNDEAVNWYRCIDLLCVPRKETPVTVLVAPIKVMEALTYIKDSTCILIPDLEPLTDIANNHIGRFTIYKRDCMYDMIHKIGKAVCTICDKLRIDRTIPRITTGLLSAT